MCSCSGSASISRISKSNARIAGRKKGATMGEYIYRVTAKVVELNDGRKAHVAKYAYKPYFGFNTDPENRRMHFRSGCTASDRMTLKNNLLVVLDEKGEAGVLYDNAKRLTSFSDDATFGTKRLPRIADVSRGSIQDFYVIDNTTI